MPIAPRSYPRSPRSATVDCSVGDALDNALVNHERAVQAGCVRQRTPFRRGPLATLADLEEVTSAWVHWHNNQRLIHRIGRVPSTEADHYATTDTADRPDTQTEVCIKPGTLHRRSLGTRGAQNMRDQPTVDVLVVTYQSSADLPWFLDSLPAMVGEIKINLIAVDNASTDGSADLLADRAKILLRNGRNVGLTRAINQAAAVSDAEWLLVVNPDTRLVHGSIAALIRTAMDTEVAGAIGPRIRDLDGNDYPTGRRFPSVIGGALHALLGAVWPNNPATRAYHHQDRPTNSPTVVDWISGACMLIRREAFDAVGGFDTSYFMYFEEVDICLRLARAGWRVVLDPQAEIVHREGGSTRSRPFRKVLNHHRSALRFFCRQHEHDRWIWFTPLVAAGLAVRALLSLALTCVRRPR